MMFVSPLMIMRCCLFALIISPMVGAEQIPTYYWSGDQKIIVDLALDEVIIIADDNALPQEKARGLVQLMPFPGQKSRVRLEAKQRDALITQSQQLAKQPGVKAVRAALYPPEQHRSDKQMGVLTSQLAVCFTLAQDQAAILQRYQLVVIEKVSYSPNTFICSPRDGNMLAALDIANLLYEQERVIFATPLIERQLLRRGDSTDPLFSQQWHLKNTGQAGGASGNDLNVTSVWNFAALTGLGTGVNVSVVDDSLQLNHPDLVSNVRTDIDLDINGGDADPSPGSVDDTHGTNVGGVIAANGNNGIGGSGVAPGAKLVGIRLISGPIDDTQEAQAITHQLNPASALDQIHVSNNSWGPNDDGVVLGIPGPLMLAGLESGVTNGRGGKGIIYTWAAGNGNDSDRDGIPEDDISNYDGYAGSRFVIAVGAAAPNGQQASYSEMGTNVLINAPGGERGGAGIVTTDRTGEPGDSTGDYSAISGNVIGTSFSTPAVAGVIALMLEANPALTWRDVRHILVRTATQNHSVDASWGTNGAGRNFSLKYGYGRANAAAAVLAAASTTWVQVPPQAAPITISEAVSVAIPDNNMTGISLAKSLTAPAGFKTEYVELKLSMTHTYRGDVRFQLTAPSGMVSDFKRRPFDFNDNYSNLVLTSVAHWGENPTGNWTLRVLDEDAGIAGILTAWSVTVYGYVPHALPTLTSLSPGSFAAGTGPTTMVVTGSNFAQGSTKIRWNGVDLPTTVNSSTQAQVTVTAGLIVSVGTATVTVANYGFDGESTLVSGSLPVSIVAPPVITLLPSSSVTTNEDVAVVASVTASDADTAANALIFSATSSNQTLITNSNCVFSATGFTRQLTMTPNPDVVGTATITVTVSDGVGSDSDSFSFVVTSINDPPVALGGRFQVRGSTLLTGTVTGFDPEGSSLSFLNVTDPPGGGTFTFNTTSGQFTFTRVQTGMTSFTYTVFDGVTVSDPAVAYITVTGDPNGIRPLIVSEPSDEVLAVGEGFVYSVMPSFSRYAVAPISSNIAYSLVGAPTDMAISSSGVVTWTASGVNRHISFGVQVRDILTGALDTQQIMLRIVAGSASN